LMAIATLTFWMGRNVFIHIPPGGAEWLTELLSSKGLKAIAKLSIIFIFIAVFWALFDQTGSSWVLQAEDLNRNWLGMNWLSSQIQAVNCFLAAFTRLFGRKLASQGRGTGSLFGENPHLLKLFTAFVAFSAAFQPFPRFILSG